MLRMHLSGQVQRWLGQGKSSVVTLPVSKDLLTVQYHNTCSNDFRTSAWQQSASCNCCYCKPVQRKT